MEGDTHIHIGTRGGEEEREGGIASTSSQLDILSIQV